MEAISTGAVGEPSAMFSDARSMMLASAKQTTMLKRVHVPARVSVMLAASRFIFQVFRLMGLNSSYLNVPRKVALDYFIVTAWLTLKLFISYFVNLS